VYSIRIAPVPIVATLIKEGKVSSASVSTTCTVSGRVATYVGTIMITATNKKAITASARPLVTYCRVPPNTALSPPARSGDKLVLSPAREAIASCSSPSKVV